MPYYRDLVEAHLGITRDHLDKYKETIVARLDSAYNVMTSAETTAVNRDLFGINQCAHLASSIVLLDRTSGTLETSTALDSAINEMRNRFPNNDPTTVLTVATLCYLLVDYMGQDLNQEQIKRNVEYIRKRFDAVNWMVGLEVKNALEIP